MGLPCTQCPLLYRRKDRNVNYYYRYRIHRDVDSIPFGKDGYTLVRAADEDRDYVLECMRDTILHSVPKEEKDLRDLWIDDILQIVSNNMDTGVMENEAFILRNDDGNAGMLWMGVSKDQYTCEDTGYLLGIFVDERLRGQGLGKELIRSAERWCGSKCLMSMTLNVGSVNSGAQRLYESMGYKCQSVVMRRMLK